MLTNPPILDLAVAIRLRGVRVPGSFLKGQVAACTDEYNLSKDKSAYNKSYTMMMIIIVAVLVGGRWVAMDLLQESAEGQRLWPLMEESY